jgi:hypothetical protein
MVLQVPVTVSGTVFIGLPLVSDKCVRVVQSSDFLCHPLDDTVLVPGIFVYIPAT